MLTEGRLLLSALTVALTTQYNLIKLIVIIGLLKVMPLKEMKILYKGKWIKITNTNVMIIWIRLQYYKE